MSRFLDRRGLSPARPWLRPVDSEDTGNDVDLIQEFEEKLKTGIANSATAIASMRPADFEVLLATINPDALKDLAKRLYEDAGNLQALVIAQRAYIAALKNHLSLGPVVQGGRPANVPMNHPVDNVVQWPVPGHWQDTDFQE